MVRIVCNDGMCVCVVCGVVWWGVVWSGGESCGPVGSGFGPVGSGLVQWGVIWSSGVKSGNASSECEDHRS